MRGKKRRCENICGRLARQRPSSIRQSALATGASETQQLLDGRMAGKASNYGHPRIHLDLRFELPLAGERFFG